jgi:hypothetical protein
MDRLIRRFFAFLWLPSRIELLFYSRDVVTKRSQGMRSRRFRFRPQVEALSSRFVPSGVDPTAVVAPGASAIVPESPSSDTPSDAGSTVDSAQVSISDGSGGDGSGTDPMDPLFPDETDYTVASPVDPILAY